ncbi:pentraxin-related protein PTX3-like [Salvelinus alpinus]|uniref:pentraxin-related protein PTX3-like n=1 Tax=Salvelinus alpinus TaxID=8036 RepID=UPI0039FD023E
MLVNRVWHVVCVLCCVCVSVCVNAEEYEVNYTDNYDNEITQDQQDGDSPVTTCQATELSRWNKLFVALENSHQRDMMLMEALEQRCGTPGVCQQCLPAIEAVCRGQAEQASSRLHRGLVELKEEVTEREGRMNSSLQQIRQEGAESYGRMMAVLHHLLQNSKEQNHRLHRLEESKLRGEVTEGAGSIGAGHREAEPIRTGHKENGFRGGA